MCTAPGASPFGDIGDSFARSQIDSLFAKGIVAGTSSTTYAPDAVVTREQMAVFLLKTYEDAFQAEYGPVARHPFTDTAGSFAREAIDQLFDAGITGGCATGSYCPADGVTREQMAVFLVRLWEYLTDRSPLVVATPFTDISTSFAGVQIAQLVGLGVTGGTSAATFGPGDPVTREQLAAFLVALERSLS